MIKHIACAAALAGLLQPVSAGLDLGDDMVDTGVRMKSVDGSMTSIDEVAGSTGTLVIFTCNHCPFVKGWQQEMVAIGNEYLDKGIGTIFINSNDPSAAGDTFEGMQQLAEKEGYQFPYVVDETSDIARHYGATKTPDVFLFDAEGKLVYSGAVGEGGRKPKAGGDIWLRDAIEALLAGEEIEPQKTQAVGCSIKFR